MQIAREQELGSAFGPEKTCSLDLLVSCDPSAATEALWGCPCLAGGSNRKIELISDDGFRGRAGRLDSCDRSTCFLLVTRHPNSSELQSWLEPMSFEFLSF